jgi:hypothetical protein
MGSVPVANAGLGSAINNAVSRVGQPLLLALIYLALTGVFFNVLGDLAPGLDTSSQAVRSMYQPLNPPPPGTDPATTMAVNQASTDAFRLAILIDAALLLGGAAVNGLGLKRGAPVEQATSEAQPTGAS